MKKLLFLCGTFLMATLVFSQKNEINPDGYNVFYHENGKVASEGMMADGKPDGYWKTYYETGVLKSEGNRVDFKLDSVWKFYDEKGDLILEINYSEGKKNGIRKTILGDEVIEETFRNDVKQGPTIYYYPDGNVWKIIPFVNGLEEGIAREFNQEGTIISLVEYKRGFVVNRERINRTDQNGLKQGKWKFFHENGRVRLEGNYRNDKENGYFKEYDENGNLITVSKYVNGELLEDVPELVELEVRTDYYPSGKVKSIASYKDDMPEGIRRDYNEDGSIKMAYIFSKGVITGEGILNEKGIKNGLWKEYYDGRRLKSEGRYEDGKRVGEWKFYFPDGKIEQTGTYNKLGNFDGTWRWYYLSGNILREEYFLNGVPDGYYVEYTEDGDILVEGEYIDGYENGKWVFNYGDTREEGEFRDGMKNGKWKAYYSDGSLAFEGEFIDDNPNGRHTYYWPNGRVKKEGRYIMGRKQGDWTLYNEDGSPFLVISYENGIEKRYDGIKIKPEMEEDVEDLIEE